MIIWKTLKRFVEWKGNKWLGGIFQVCLFRFVYFMHESNQMFVLDRYVLGTFEI